MLGRFQIGTMQGRLLPKYQGRYQAFPAGNWAAEFSAAKQSGIELIEFILDFEGAEENPLLADPAAIKATASQSGVSVISICADYFMEAPLHRTDAARRVLERLMDSAAIIGARDIVVPCVDQSSLSGEKDAAEFVAVMADAAPVAASRGLNLSLETDLGPAEFAGLLDRIGSDSVTVNYDTGNSASLGFDAGEELSAYGTRITDIHIKDRALGGGPAELGAGDCDFDAVFNWLAASDYQGPLIMQAYRDDEGIAIFRSQLAWLQSRYGDLLN